MCGIVGLKTPLPRENALAAIERMVCSLRHRGPDGSGVVEVALPRDAGHLMLGHTRLSILDLSERSNQPARDRQTGSWLIYNGEIYNFRELRRELEQCGFCFKSTGDTEVLLTALVHWGTAALKRLRGMFAFAFWNATSYELLLARDPFGIKPLYYLQQGGTLLFASEIRALQAAGICQFSPDPDGVNSFLSYGAVIGPRTVFKQVNELPPGHMLKIHNFPKEIRPEPYWSLDYGVVRSTLGFADAVEWITGKVSAAVDSHLVSDVPVGVFFSGGVDSSLIAAVAAKQKNDITLLTVGFPEQKYSEAPFAAEVAQKLPSSHKVVNLTSGEFQSFLSGGLEAMDQPTIDGLNTYVISGVASSLGLRVLLSGLGGDELFGGYTTFRKVPWLLRCHNIMRPWAGLASRMSSNPVQWVKIREAAPCHSLREAYLLQRSIRWHKVPIMSLPRLSSLWRELTAEQSDDFFRIACFELLFYTRNQLLRDVDVFSMSKSVEVRVPLLDLELANAALSLPKACHFDAQGGKKITRTILKNLGVNLPCRRKQGFSFPWPVWLRGPLKDVLRDTLYQRNLYEAVGLDWAYGMQLMKNFEAEARGTSWSEVWSLFVLLDWQKKNQPTTLNAPKRPLSDSLLPV